MSLTPLPPGFFSTPVASTKIQGRTEGSPRRAESKGERIAVASGKLSIESRGTKGFSSMEKEKVEVGLRGIRDGLGVSSPYAGSPQ